MLGLSVHFIVLLIFFSDAGGKLPGGYLFAGVRCQGANVRTRSPAYHTVSRIRFIVVLSRQVSALYHTADQGRRSYVFFWVRTHPLFEMNCLLLRLHPT